MWILVYDNEDGGQSVFSAFCFNSKNQATYVANTHYKYFVEKYKIYPFELIKLPKDYLSRRK